MLYLLLITIYLLLFAHLSWRKSDWAIYLLIFTLPSYLIRFHVGSVPTTLLECMILVLFAAWLVKQLVAQKYKNNPATQQSSNQAIISKFPNFQIINYQLPITLFLLAATISIFISPDIRAAAGIWKAYFIEPILLLIVFTNTITIKKIKSVFVFLCLCVCALSCFAIFQKFTGAFISNPFWAAEATRRVTSLFPYPNALALFLAPITILLIGLLAHKLKNWKLEIGNWKLFGNCILYLVSCIPGLFAIYFARSKGALLAIFIGIIFYAIFYKPYRKYFIGLLICIFVTSSFCIFVLNNPINLRGQSSVEGGDSISTRLEIWQETWSMLKNKPILGAGLAGYQTALAPFHQKDYIEIYLYPHNIILNFWSEIGLLGLIAFIWIVVLFYLQGFKTMKQPNTLLHCYIVTLLSSMTALLIHGLVDVPYFKNDLSILFWLIVGSLIVLQKEKPKTIT